MDQESHVPLRRLAVCLDCEETFDVMKRTICPACASRSFYLVARWIDKKGVRVVQVQR